MLLCKAYCDFRAILNYPSTSNLLTAAILPELQCGIALLGPPALELMVQDKEQQLCFAGAAMKRYPTPKVRETQVR